MPGATMLSELRSFIDHVRIARIDSPWGHAAAADARREAA
jgi:hypothetical protein